MYVIVMEDNDGNPIAVQIFFGKSGSHVSAWADAMARVCSIVLDHGGSLNDLIVELSGISSDMMQTDSNGVTTHSDIEALCHALMHYRADKSHRDHGTIYTDSRAPRLGGRTRTA